MPHSLFSSASSDIRKRLDAIPTMRLFDSFDWAATPLGPVAAWPEALRVTTRLMMGSSVPMVTLVGPDGILIYNEAYAEFAGNRHPAIFGIGALQAWPEIADFNRQRIDAGLRGETLRLVDQDLVLNRHGTPETLWLDLNYSPIMGDDGTAIGTLCVALETTGRVQAERALARSEERLSLAIRGSEILGTWDWDVHGDLVVADAGFARLYGIDPLAAGQGVPIARFLAAIYPPDRDRVTAEIEQALREGVEYRSEYRVVAPDGALRWVLASGTTHVNDAGQLVRFPGVVVDITAQKEASVALAQSEMRFRTLADSMPQMVWSTLPDGYHDYYNARWYEFTGTPPGSTDGEGWNGMFHADDQSRAWARWRHSLQTGELYEIEYRLRHHSGGYRWVLGRAVPMRDAQGTITRWFGTCTDIHEAKMAEQERELIAQELSHRIKNIFSVISGLVALSARTYPELKPMASELRQRIVSLGQAHDFVRPHSPLSRSAYSHDSLRGLVNKLMEPYEDAGAPRIAFSGDDVSIDDGAATPLALLFHELATNSAKHGALSSPHGTVTINARLDGDRYEVNWKESGGPAIAAPSAHQGFGSRLVALSVEGQLRGEVERLWESDGLRVVMTIPHAVLRRTTQADRSAT